MTHYEREAITLLQHAANALNQVRNHTITDDKYPSTYQLVSAIEKFLREWRNE